MSFLSHIHELTQIGQQNKTLVIHDQVERMKKKIEKAAMQGRSSIVEYIETLNDSTVKAIRDYGFTAEYEVSHMNESQWVISW